MAVWICLNHKMDIVFIWLNVLRLFIDHFNIFIDIVICGLHQCILINCLFDDLYRRIYYWFMAHNLI